MRDDLRSAMKERRTDVVSALRTALATLDNAEAVEASGSAVQGSEHVAGAASGVGATEAVRRTLTLDDVQGLLRALVEEQESEASRYDSLGQGDAAAQLRAGAAALAAYLG